jgi:hypothetical protein
MDVKEKFGWRVGMEVRSFQGLGMYVKLELGDRPGIHNGSIFGGNLYMLANLGFSLGKGLKK